VVAPRCRIFGSRRFSNQAPSLSVCIAFDKRLYAWPMSSAPTPVSHGGRERTSRCAARRSLDAGRRLHTNLDHLRAAPTRQAGPQPPAGGCGRPVQKARPSVSPGWKLQCERSSHVALIPHCGVVSNEAAEVVNDDTDMRCLAHFLRENLRRGRPGSVPSPEPQLLCA
jgi:hypothetical protein